MAAARGISDRHLSKMGVKTAGVASSVMFGKIITFLVAGIGLIVVARLLTQTLYGVYVLISSIAGLAVSFGTLGISTSFSKFIAEYRAKRQSSKLNEMISSGYLVTMGIGIILTLVVFGLSNLISRVVFGTAQYSYLVSAGSILIIGSLVYGISSYALIGFGKKNAIVGITFLQVFAQAAISIVLAAYHFGVMAPIAGVSVGYLLGTIATLAYMSQTERIRFLIPSWAAVKELMVFSLPLGLYNAASGIATNLSNLILGAFSTTSVVGNVAITQKISTTINSANESVAASLVPLFASAVQPGVKTTHISRLYNYALYLTFVIFAPVALYMAFFSKEIIYMVLGTGFPTAQFYLPIVSIGLMLMMVSDYTTSLLVGRNKVKPIMKYGTLAYIIEVIVLLLLVPTFKGYGMVVAVSLVLPTTLLLFYHKAIADSLGVKLHTRRAIQVVAIALLATLIVFPISLLVHPVSLINDVAITVATVAVLIIIYPPLLAVTRTMARKDVEIIKTISEGIPAAGRVLYYLAEYAGMFTRS